MGITRRASGGQRCAGSASASQLGQSYLGGPLKAELGALHLFMAGGFANASAGLSLEWPLSATLSPFLSVGAGGGLGCVGVVIDFYPDRTLRLLVDGGAWYGLIGSEGHRNRTFLSPMLGVGMYVSI